MFLALLRAFATASSIVKQNNRTHRNERWTQNSSFLLGGLGGPVRSDTDPQTSIFAGSMTFNEKKDNGKIS
jgi:hypothetical protein